MAGEESGGGEAGGTTTTGTGEPAMTAVPGTNVPTTEGTREAMQTPAPAIPAPVNAPSPFVPFSPGLLFFTGGVMVLAVIIITDLAVRYRR